MAKRVKRPEIIVFHGKHGDTIYLANTPEDMRAAMLTEVISRYENGWFYEPEPDTYWERNLSDAERAFLDMSDEDIAKLPEALQEQGKKIKARKERAEREFRAEMEEWEDIELLYKTYIEQGAVAARDLLCPRYADRNVYLAKYIIETREGYEYEGYEIDYLTPTLVDKEEAEKAE